MRRVPASGGGGDANGFDADTFGGLAAFTTAANGRRRVANPAEHVVTFDQLTEGGVLAVEEFCVGEANEKLAAGRVGVLRTGHGDDAAHVRFFVELGFYFVTRAAGADHRVVFFAERVAALDHEAFDDAVEG